MVLFFPGCSNRLLGTAWLRVSFVPAPPFFLALALLCGPCRMEVDSCIPRAGGYGYQPVSDIGGLDNWHYMTTATTLIIHTATQKKLKNRPPLPRPPPIVFFLICIAIIKSWKHPPPTILDHSHGENQCSARPTVHV